MSLKKIHKYLLLCGFCLIFVLFNGCDINQSQSKEFKKEINISIPEIKEDPIYAKLSELKTQLNTGRSYLAYQGYIDILKQAPSQEVINKIAEATGESSHTVNLVTQYMDRAYFNIKWRPVFSKDDKKIYFVKKEQTGNNVGRNEMLCELNLESYEERIIAKKLGYWRIKNLEVTNENHLSLVLEHLGPHRDCFIKSLNLNNKVPYNEDDFDAMADSCYNCINKLKGIYSCVKPEKIADGHSYIRVLENGNDAFLLAADGNLLRLAGYDPTNCKYKYGSLLQPVFSPDKSQIGFVMRPPCSDDEVLTHLFE